MITENVARSSNCPLGLYSMRIISGVSTVNRALPWVTVALSLAFGLSAVHVNTVAAASMDAVINFFMGMGCF